MDICGHEHGKLSHVHASREDIVNTTKWTHADGVEQNRALEAASASAKTSRSRQSREEQRRWRMVRPAAVALLDFAYRPLDNEREGSKRSARRGPSIKQIEEERREEKDRKDRCLRSLNMMWRECPDEWIPLRASRESVDLRWEDARRVQADIRDAIARLVLQYREGGGPGRRLWGTDWIRIRVVLYRARADSIVGSTDVQPDYGRLVLAAGAVLRRSLPWLRFCALCGHLFFKVKRQITCSPLCYSVLQARKRPDRRPKGDTRGRKPRNYSTANEVEHTSWLRAAYRRRIRRAA